MNCQNHPDKAAAYFDYILDRGLCSDCIFDWYKDRRGDHHSITAGKPMRITAQVPEFKLTISNLEYAQGRGQHFDLVLGVSDTYEERDTHWFPINEVAPWSFAPFFWFKRIMDKAVKEDKSVLLHCHAGAHRSKMMAFVWLIHKGWKVEEIQEKLHMPRQLAIDIEKGYVPIDVFWLLEVMEEHPGWSLAGCLREMGKSHLLNNGVHTK